MPNYTRPPATELAKFGGRSAAGAYRWPASQSKQREFLNFMQIAPTPRASKKNSACPFWHNTHLSAQCFCKCISVACVCDTIYTTKATPASRQEMDQLTRVSARICVFGELHGHDLHESGAENERILLSTFACARNTQERDKSVCACNLYMCRDI